MNVRHLQSRDDVRAVLRINRAAWRAAYDDFLPDEVLDRGEPSEDDVTHYFDRVRDDRDRFLVAERATPASDGRREAPPNERTGGAREQASGSSADEGSESDGEIVGYAYVRWAETKSFVAPDEAGLKEIYVHPDHWDDGVGTGLLERAVELVPDDATALVLEAFAENDVGAGFYRARGFERVGSREVEVAGERYESAIWTREL